MPAIVTTRFWNPNLNQQIWSLGIRSKNFPSHSSPWGAGHWNNVENSGNLYLPFNVFLLNWLAVWVFRVKPTRCLRETTKGWFSLLIFQPDRILPHAFLAEGMQINQWPFRLRNASTYGRREGFEAGQLVCELFFFLVAVKDPWRKLTWKPKQVVVSVDVSPFPSCFFSGSILVVGGVVSF